ncbi:hypothetical protein [Bacillus sp. B15-48]|uniref:hypothetical protein n=1 Tax=Bacillus sp. B15-48 TaxID=1548601 RepID=UPI00193FE187|nr:hypothetical protein [Bacillus sp. B15-48]MBM4763252.1 hypothetical protein [Bacillus sp. B15-48]
MDTVKFKKTNVPLMVVLSYFTAGVYIAYWFLSRRKTFDKMQTNDLRVSFIHIMLAINIVIFVYSIVKGAIFGEVGILIIDSIEWILAFLALGCLYYSVFRAKESIEDELGETLYRPWLLIVFHVWYLQYKINQTDLKGA